MARGDLKSFHMDDLVEQARKAFEEENCKELWLTSEDLGKFYKILFKNFKVLGDEILIWFCQIFFKS